MNSFILSCNSIASDFVGIINRLLGPLIGTFLNLGLVSLIFGVVFAFLYGKLSNQAKIAHVKNAIALYIDEAILYRHDFLLTIRAQGLLLYSGLRYLGTTALPLLALSVPGFIIFAGIQNNFGFTNPDLKSGSELRIFVARDRSPFDISATSTELRLSPPLRIKDESLVIYNLTGNSNSTNQLAVNLGPSSSLDISKLIKPSYPAVATDSWLGALVYGSLTAPPPGIHSIEISKKFRDFAALGLTLPWYLWSIIFIMLGGIGAARFFKISI